MNPEIKYVLGPVAVETKNHQLLYEQEIQDVSLKQNTYISLVHDFADDSRILLLSVPCNNSLVDKSWEQEVLVFTSKCEVMGYCFENGRVNKFSLGSLYMYNNAWHFRLANQASPILSENFGGELDYAALERLEIEISKWYCEICLNLKKEQ